MTRLNPIPQKLLAPKIEPHTLRMQDQTFCQTNITFGAVMLVLYFTLDEH